VQDLAVPAAQGRSLSGVIESVPQPVSRKAPAAFGEQEIGWPAEPRMRQGPLQPAPADPFVQCGQGGLVERDGALGAELAERYFQPAIMAAGVPAAVELEVEQLAEPDAGAAQQGQPDAGERVGLSSWGCRWGTAAGRAVARPSPTGPGRRGVRVRGRVQRGVRPDVLGWFGLTAGAGVPEPKVAAGDALILDLPAVPVRPLADYAIGGLS